jgi:hypothetical protein
MRLASDRDNAQELRSIEVRINKNGNQHKETCYKLGNIVFFWPISVALWKKKAKKLNDWRSNSFPPIKLFHRSIELSALK